MAKKEKDSAPEKVEQSKKTEIKKEVKSEKVEKGAVKAKSTPPKKVKAEVAEEKVREPKESKSQEHKVETEPVTKSESKVETAEAGTKAEVSTPEAEEKKNQKSTESTKQEQETAPTPSVLEKFDWESYKTDDAVYTEDEREKFTSMYDKTLSTIAVNEVVEGNVIGMNKREVVINIGYKSEGVVSLNEFRYNPDLKIGDKVEVYVESQEDKKGQLVLSHKKARALRSWDRVNESLEKDEIIKGYIKCRTKGGMIVDVFGI